MENSLHPKSKGIFYSTERSITPVQGEEGLRVTDTPQMTYTGRIMSFCSRHIHVTGLIKMLGVCGGFRPCFNRLFPISPVKLRVRSCPLKYDPIFFNLVNQQPVGFNMTFSSPLPVADKLVISVDGIYRFFTYQGTGNELELLHIFSLPLHAFDVFSKPPSIDRSKHHRPNFSNISSMFLQTIRFRPASVSSKVLRVESVGMTTSNGSPWRSSTCL